VGPFSSCLLGGVAPLGQVLAGPHFEGKCILTADLDPAEMVRGKYDFDVAGHYARPDVFRLLVNIRPALSQPALGLNGGPFATGTWLAPHRRSWKPRGAVPAMT
jgi:hypothetical protein